MTFTLMRHSPFYVWNCHHFRHQSNCSPKIKPTKNLICWPNNFYENDQFPRNDNALNHFYHRILNFNINSQSGFTSDSSLHIFMFKYCVLFAKYRPLFNFFLNRQMNTYNIGYNRSFHLSWGFKIYLSSQIFNFFEQTLTSRHIFYFITHRAIDIKSILNFSG